MNKIVFTKNAWEDYLWWQQHDKKMIRKINKLIKEIMRDPFTGPGKPEPLKHDFAGLWSRRIDREHRLVYDTTDHEVRIYACRYHYDS